MAVWVFRNDCSVCELYLSYFLQFRFWTLGSTRTTVLRSVWFSLIPSPFGMRASSIVTLNHAGLPSLVAHFPRARSF